MTIQQLPEYLINQIAAGEVIEKPASIVKELVENSIDSGANFIEIRIRNAGKSFISVRDNGSGIKKEELPLAIERHATSKLHDYNLNEIKSFGFRGEALPSIASISRMLIRSKVKNEDSAWEMNLEKGKDIIPCQANEGTFIEIRDIFYAVPARLKFLRSDRYESLHIFEVLISLILATPHISYRYFIDDKEKIFLPAISETLFSESFTEKYFQRMKILFNKNPHGNYVPIDNEFNDMRLKGYLGLPTFHSSRTDRQFSFVNGRVVKDKVFFSAMKGAYADFITYGQHPCYILFLEVPHKTVDVNVHPGKTEVRFLDPQKTRSFIYHSVKNILGKESQNVASSLSGTHKQSIADYFTKDTAPTQQQTILHEKGSHFLPPSMQNFQAVIHENIENHTKYQAFPMGAAVAQLYLNYIIAQTEDNILIIDQHAAHERIVYEKMKKQLKTNQIASQKLLIPEIIKLSTEDCALLLENQPALSKIGFDIKKFGNDEIIIHTTPAMIKNPNFDDLIENFLEELKNYSNGDNFIEILERICATMACYGSIRSGRAMSIDDMNALLRQMEETPNSGQCNHGRPTFVKMSFHDLEKLFDRR